MPRITIAGKDTTFDVPEGTNLRKALLKNGFSPYSGSDALLNCRGNGLCGTCRVEVVEGKGVPAPGPLEETALVGLMPFYARSIPKNVRLSCRIIVPGDLTIGMHPAVTMDRQLTKERIALTAIWTFFGGTFFFVVVRLLLEIAKGA